MKSEVGTTWRRDVLDVVLTIAIFIALLFLASLFLPPLETVLANALAFIFGPNEFGRFLWEVFTGPPVTGALAVLAAYIAYRGLDKTVIRQDKANENSTAAIKQAREAADATAKRQDDANDNTRRANAETLRKNDEDQWWATLRWAYVEAKDFKAKERFEESAAVAAILESLAQHRPLSPVQNSTVAAVSLLFAQSDNPKTRQAVQRTQEVTAFSEYQNAVYSMLRSLDLEGVKVSEVVGAGDVGYDFIARSNQARVGIVLKLRAKPFDVQDVKEFLRTLPDPSEGRKSIPTRLLITRTPIDELARDRMLDAYPEAAAVQWRPDMSTEDVRAALSALLSADQFSADQS